MTTAAALLAAAEPENDPDRRGAQVLLAIARQLVPDADLGELVAFASHLGPAAAGMNPAEVASVAQGSGLA